MDPRVSADYSKSLIPEDVVSEPKPTDCDDVKITPEIIEAGEEALWNSDYPSPVGLTSVNTVENILEAALRAAGFVPRTSSRRRRGR